MLRRRRKRAADSSELHECQFPGEREPGLRRPMNGVTLPSECVSLNRPILGDFHSSPS
jgi:hypothetical protein